MRTMATPYVTRTTRPVMVALACAVMIGPGPVAAQDWLDNCLAAEDPADMLSQCETLARAPQCHRTAGSDDWLDACNLARARAGTALIALDRIEEAKNWTDRPLSGGDWRARAVVMEVNADAYAAEGDIETAWTGYFLAMILFEDTGENPPETLVEKHDTAEAAVMAD